MTKRIVLSVLSLLYLVFLVNCAQSSDPQSSGGGAGTGNTGASSTVYAVGDVYPKTGTPEGVVFYIDASGTHGKIVSLDQQKCAWAVLYSQACDTTKINQMKTQLSLTDGSQNYATFCSIVTNGSGNSDYGAFYWCSVFKGGSWYIPARDELVQMINVSDTINNTLTSLRNSGYNAPVYYNNKTWSSSVRAQVTGTTNVQFGVYITATGSMINNEDSYYARAIKTF
jgi:hypothetical protein